MPTIPAYASQIWLDDSTKPIKVSTGTTENLSITTPYYLVSSKAGAGTGRSLLAAIIGQLNASLVGTSWWVAMAKYGTDDYRIVLAHNNGSSRTIDVSVNTTLWLNLGFAAGNIVVAASTLVYASYPPLWWWTPDMPIHKIGPVPFNPADNYCHWSSAGSAHRSPGQVAAYTHNGFQGEAVFEHVGVQGEHKIRKISGYTNKDLETWWRNGPALGRRLIWWRDRDQAATALASHAAVVAATALDLAAPSAGSASPYRNVEYNPSDDLRANFPATPLVEGSLYHWNVRLGLWVTENNETPVDD